MVFYRKYRPQTIGELDNESIRIRLVAVLKDTAHAFLFTGPKGLGKTSTARIVAKVVNCEKNVKRKAKSEKQTIEPCNECDQCISITSGANMDVIEIDAASNRGIDEIRDLRDTIRLAPVKATKKVYIIDEVHMLTLEAFNALLKTLEEPPSHVLFILCTTELHKVPETIISRCVHIQFEKASEEDLLNSFKRIVKGEKLSVDEEALREVAQMSDGSFRDGAKLLEELVALGGNTKITTKLIEEKFRVTTIRTQVLNLRTFLQMPPQTQKSLALVDSLVKQGVDISYFLEKVIEDLHLNLLVYAGVVKSEKSQVYLSMEELKPLIDLFTKAYADTKFAVVKQLPLELAIIEWGMLNEKSESKSEIVGARGPVTSFLPVGARSSLASSDELRAVGSPAARATPRSNSERVSHAKTPRADLGGDDFLQQLINKVKLQNHSIAGLLRGCKIKIQDENRLVLETQYKFHKDRLDDKKIQDMLKKTVNEITGNSLSISVELKA